MRLFQIVLFFFVSLYMATVFKIRYKMERRLAIDERGTIRRDQLKTVLALFEREYEQHLSHANYQKLKAMVKRCMDQMVRARNLEARNLKNETGVLVSVKRKKGEGCQWKAKGQCTKGDACSFRHDESKRGKVPSQPKYSQTNVNF